MSHTQALQAYKVGEYKQAFNLWIDESSKDNDQAMVNLGLLYLKGEGVQKDISRAKEWFEKALEYHNASAYYNLALMYQNSIGVATDEQKALSYLREAFALGHRNASFHLALWLLKDRTDKERLKEGFDAMLYAAKDGHPMAKMQLGGLDCVEDLKSQCNELFRGKSYDEKIVLIEDALDRYIRPVLLKDGGNIILVEFVDGDNMEIRLVYQGNCSGCSLSFTGTYSMVYEALSSVIDKQIKVYVL
ncbi:MAG: SEL1-like repeat protein [Campylobacterales bacterium]|nr:SEL1-like repeat protein [Campylobacterales bacterium]